MDFILRLKKILEAYREGAHQDLLDDLLPLLYEAVQKQTASIKGAKLETRELEELLSVVRELKDNYEKLDQKTGQQMIRIDELKQMEYKLTELLLQKRI